MSTAIENGIDSAILMTFLTVIGIVGITLMFVAFIGWLMMMGAVMSIQNGLYRCGAFIVFIIATMGAIGFIIGVANDTSY